jgi:hypothetical protein
MRPARRKTTGYAASAGRFKLPSDFGVQIQIEERSMKTRRGLVEQSLKVDINPIVRTMRQSQLSGCTLSWVVGSQQVGGVAAMAHDRLLVFVGGQDFSAGMVWRRPHFGGIAASLLCPSCARTKRTLFVASNRMECRQCGGLKYKSQLEHGSARVRRKALKAMCRIDPDHASLTTIPARRAGMHRRTYLRAIFSVANLLQVSDAALNDEFLRLKEAGLPPADQSIE